MIRSFLQKIGERKPDDYFGRLDPRAKLIALVLVLLVASFERTALIGLFVIIAVWAIISGLWKIFVFSTLGGLIGWLGFIKLLMPLSSDKVDDPFMLFAGLVLRLSIFTVIGVWFAVKTNLYEFECSLEKWGVPSHVVLPFIIAIRFIPTLLAEFSAIRDAMKQRQLFTSFSGVVASPTLSFKCFITPMLIRSLKMADELTVAAETRGIGRPVGRSYYREVSFKRNDYVFLGLLFGLIVVNDILFRLPWAAGWVK